MEEVTNYLYLEYPLDVLYLDCQKAFDKIPHTRLIAKLHMVLIMRSYSGFKTGSRQTVVINGH